MARKVDLKGTSRTMAYELSMNTPDPMVLTREDFSKICRHQ